MANKRTILFLFDANGTLEVSKYLNHHLPYSLNILREKNFADHDFYLKKKSFNLEIFDPRNI